MSEKRFTEAEWRIEATRRFGTRARDWAFVSGLTDTVRKLQIDGGSARVEREDWDGWFITWDQQKSRLIQVHERLGSGRAECFDHEEITGDWIWEPEP